MATAKEVLTKILNSMTLKDSGLFGCQRKRAWDRDEGLPFHQNPGIALLAVAGDRGFVNTPAGHVEFFTNNGRLMQFRGGPWRADWMPAIIEFWSVIYAYGGVTIPEIALVHEVSGDIDVHIITLPELARQQAAQKAAALVAGALADPPARIAKNDGRAYKLCSACAHRTRCNGFDVLNNDTSDWSDSYRLDLGTK